MQILNIFDLVVTLHLQFQYCTYLNGITLHWNNNYSLSFPLPKDQQGEKNQPPLLCFHFSAISEGVKFFVGL